MKYLFAVLVLIALPFGKCFGFEVDLSQKEQISADKTSLLPQKGRNNRSQTIKNPMDDFKDEDIFISIEGGDSLTWKSLREWIAYTVEQVGYRVDMQDAGSAAMRNMVLQKELSKNLKSYLRYALVAKEALRQGIKLDEAKLAQTREEWFDVYRKSGASGAAKLKAAQNPDSFFEHSLTNSVLWHSYAEQFVRPNLVITQEEIAKRMALQDKMIADAIATNEFKRLQIYRILNAVKYASGSDRMSFSEAAAKWTEDYNGDVGGVFADENDQPRDLVSGDVIKQVEDAYNKLKPGEISDVVETPYSWHVVKLINRNLDDEGNEESVNIAHVMLEKVPMPATMSEENVKHRISNSKLRIAMEEKYIELLKSEKVNCLIPMFDKEEKNSKKKIKHLQKAN